jgi:hypothetical protein
LHSDNEGLRYRQEIEKKLSGIKRAEGWTYDDESFNNHFEAHIYTGFKQEAAKDGITDVRTLAALFMAPKLTYRLIQESGSSEFYDFSPNLWKRDRVVASNASSVGSKGIHDSWERMHLEDIREEGRQLFREAKAEYEMSVAPKVKFVKYSGSPMPAPYAMTFEDVTSQRTTYDMFGLDNGDVYARNPHYSSYSVMDRATQPRYIRIHGKDMTEKEKRIAERYDEEMLSRIQAYAIPDPGLNKL